MWFVSAYAKCAFVLVPRSSLEHFDWLAFTVTTTSPLKTNVAVIGIVFL